MDFRRRDGLIDACMMDGWNELTDAFSFLVGLLGRFWPRDRYGKSREMFCLFSGFFFGHEDYGMPFLSADSSLRNLSSSWLVAADVPVVVCLIVLFS